MSEMCIKVEFKFQLVCRHSIKKSTAITQNKYIKVVLVASNVSKRRV